MKSLKEKIEVMQAALDGKEIEKQTDDEWYQLLVEPELMSFDWAHYDYRIKQEPMEFYAVILESGTASICNNEKEYLKAIMAKEKTSNLAHRIIKAREVTE